MLGMIIGVGAVIASVSIGSGAKAQVESADCQPGREHAADLPRLLQFQRRARWVGATPHADRGGRRGHSDAAPGRCAPSARKTAPAPRSSPAIRTGTPASWANPPSTFKSANGRWPKAKCSPNRQVRSAAKVCVIGKTVAAAIVPRRRSARQDRSASSSCSLSDCRGAATQGPVPHGTGPG